MESLTTIYCVHSQIGHEAVRTKPATRKALPNEVGNGDKHGGNGA